MCQGAKSGGRDALFVIGQREMNVFGGLSDARCRFVGWRPLVPPAALGAPEAAYSAIDVPGPDSAAVLSSQRTLIGAAKLDKAIPGV